MTEFLPKRYYSNFEVFSGRQGSDELLIFVTSHLKLHYPRKKLKPLKQVYNFPSFPSPEWTGYRKRYLA